ncbi:MAG: hypothetical protein IJZ55_01540 [Lachnospiraceae bacterium]|nr:hypothetical protein [Lachnospiraceae bacterium]
MEGKNIPPIITLTAAMVACVICILRGASLYTTLKIVLLVMIVFYIIGRIAQKILVKIDNDAEEAALQRQREEQERAAKELEEAELAKQKEAESTATANQTEQENNDETSVT